MDLGEAYETILDYFEESYIGMCLFDFVNLEISLHVYLYTQGRLRPNHTRRNPVFPIEFWNMCNRSIQLLMRTNNSAEAYHRRIRSVFQCVHPTLWLFWQKLIEEENSTHADILQIHAGKAPKKKNDRLEQRLLRVITNNNPNILHQIDSIAQNVSL